MPPETTALPVGIYAEAPATVASAQRPPATPPEGRAPDSAAAKLRPAKVRAAPDCSSLQSLALQSAEPPGQPAGEAPASGVPGGRPAAAAGAAESSGGSRSSSPSSAQLQAAPVSDLSAGSDALPEGRGSGGMETHAGAGSSGVVQGAPVPPAAAGTLVAGKEPTSGGGGGGGGARPAVTVLRLALLVPCRPAMRGRFPLNGTYFQARPACLQAQGVHSVRARCSAVVHAFQFLGVHPQWKGGTLVERTSCACAACCPAVCPADGLPCTSAQVNEVFLDHTSLAAPLQARRPPCACRARGPGAHACGTLPKIITNAWLSAAMASLYPVDMLRSEIVQTTAAHAAAMHCKHDHRGLSASDVVCTSVVQLRMRSSGTHVTQCTMANSARASPQVDPAAVAAWPRRTVHFGASVVSVCRGMRQHGVAALFASGFLCVRAYVPSTGAPAASLNNAA